MRLVALSCLTMIAFASNSILNRVGVASGGMDAVSFGIVRLVAGAVMLALLVLLRNGGLRLGGPTRWLGVGALLVYTFGFSLAYDSLDAGLGALILFGMVQITMFAGALVGGERPGLQRWIGASLAFGGLVWLLWPGQSAAPSLSHALSMAAAGVAWGVYSLNGRGGSDPLGDTAANFILAAAGAGLFAAISVLLPTSSGIPEATVSGLLIAILCGAVTSGLGYALWYTVLPDLRSTTAAVLQLTVPVIAMVGGVLLLSETVGVRLMIAACFVLGGVLLAVTSRR
ncbi:DMT family transporter [Marivita sp. S6314]|uniref:DMT family transporter n=1 Tax=Marivita sp. S6314 TaxID=2926406 RepID=UPI001FF4EC7A|nr:DMT family transporter [Marivita sp. S6314]MCK0150396.1 DMT family transporter [Marivita sp. S6314]